MADYFRTLFLPPREADAADQAFSDMMKDVQGSKTGTAVASKKDVQPNKTDDDDAELVFKMDMDG